jgi:hypothetical protein
MVRQAAIDFNCASWAKVLPSAWDIWDDACDSIVERVAGVALPGSRGALARHAHQAARVIEDSRCLRVVSSQ